MLKSTIESKVTDLGGGYRRFLPIVSGVVV